MTWRGVFGAGVLALWVAPFAACGGTVSNASNRTPGTGGSGVGMGGATGGQSSGGSAAGGTGVGGNYAGESHCVFDADCMTPFRCAVDGLCRNPCRTDADCGIPGQICAVSGSCADKAEIDPVTRDLPNANGGCGVTSTPDERITLDLYVLLDQSMSMGCPILAGGDRWTALKSGLEAFAADPVAAGTGLGIGYFGNGSSSCNSTDYETPDVEVAPLPANAGAISGSLDGKSPSTNTPTAAALSGAIAHATMWQQSNSGHMAVVVLVTDGQPDACGAVQDVAGAAAAGLAGGQVATHVIAITSPRPVCPLDPNPPNVSDLDTVARAGGTDRALVVDTSSDAVRKVVDALETITGRCRLRIPPPPQGQTFDPTKVNVEYTTPSGAFNVAYLSTGRNACDPSTGGWYYDDPVTPTQVVLCPATCTLTTPRGPGFGIRLVFGCGITEPNPI